MLEQTPEQIAGRRWAELDALAETRASDESTDGFNIGMRDGFSEAVQLIDMWTGGDGEYRYCTNHDPDLHTPDPAAMIARILARFAALTPQVSA